MSYRNHNAVESHFPHFWLDAIYGRASSKAMPSRTSRSYDPQRFEMHYIFEQTSMTHYILITCDTYNVT